MARRTHRKRLIVPRARLLTAARTAVSGAAVALLSAVLAAGCGSSGGSPPAKSGWAAAGGSSAAKGAAAASPGSSAPDQAQFEQAQLAFAKCMRSSGVPAFPDPQPGGGFAFHARAGVTSSPAFEAAQAKCRKLLPGGGPPGPGAQTHPSPQTLSRMLKIARCMRRHGISEFPDPMTSVPHNLRGVREISDIEGTILVFPETIDQQSPAFTQAAAACAFPLHNH